MGHFSYGFHMVTALRATKPHKREKYAKLFMIARLRTMRLSAGFHWDIPFICCSYNLTVQYSCIRHTRTSMVGESLLKIKRCGTLEVIGMLNNLHTRATRLRSLTSKDLLRLSNTKNFGCGFQAYEKKTLTRKTT